MKLQLNIGENHIRLGKQSDPANCAIARAIKDKLGEKVYSVGVFPTNVLLSVMKKNKLVNYKGQLNKSTNTFIKRFDKGLPVNSFKLRLSLKRNYKYSLV